MLLQDIPVVAAVHFAVSCNDIAGSLCVLQAVRVLRADGTTDAHNRGVTPLFSQKHQSTLQSIAAQIGMNRGTVGIGPVLPVACGNAQMPGIVMFSVAAVTQNKKSHQSLVHPNTDAKILVQHFTQFIFGIRQKQIRVRHGGAHLILQPAVFSQILLGTFTDLCQYTGRLAFVFFQNDFHTTSPEPQNAKHFSILYHKPHIKKSNSMV